MRRLIKIGLFLLPIFVMPISVNEFHINPRDARELLFQSFVIIALGFAIGRWVKWFVCWMIINWWFNFFLPFKSSAILFNIALGLLLFYLIKTYIQEKDINGIFKIICITALFQVFWLGIQALKIDPIWHPITAIGDRTVGTVALIGFLGNKNVLGAYLALCLPIFRVRWKWGMPFVILGLFISRSSMAIIAGFSGLAFFEIFMAIWQKKIKKLICLFVAIIILLTGFFLFVDKPNLDRVVIWKKLVAQTFGWNRIVGQGMGRFINLRIYDKTKTRWDNPHNEFLQIYLELGIIGLLLFLGYLIDLFVRLIKFCKTEVEVMLFAGITVILVNSLGMFPFQLAPTAFLGIVYFGLLEGILCQRRQNLLLMN